MSLLATLPTDPLHLFALVDMGSNGIRFSITTLQPPTARIMPTLYQHRAAISLYDAQYTEEGSKVPIPESTITAVVLAFKSFKRTCADFKLPPGNITVLATEATRSAFNSEAFMWRIKDELGWEVKLLPKEEEGRIGAMGVASSLPEVKGLVMDLGGGSTQLSWIVKGGGKNGDGRMIMSKAGAVSLPYGAAAILRRIKEAEKTGDKQSLKEFESEVKKQIKDAYAQLGVPEELEAAAKKKGGFTLFLSGGGFRGWGYILMNRHRVKPYPIPVINGFRVKRKEFMHTEEVKKAAAAALEEDGDEDDIFRVSDRRASQVPAVSFLISALADALPHLKQVRFCQGGVREGYLFSSMDAATRSQHPLVVATKQFAVGQNSDILVKLLQNAIPPGATDHSEDEYKSVFNIDVLTAFANLMYLHAIHPKDLQASAALRSTTSGALASVHGLLHESRIALALLLCARWGGAVPPSDEQFKRDLEELLDSDWVLWWIKYIGAVASLIATVYAAGISDDERDLRTSVKAEWDDNVGNKDRTGLRLVVQMKGDIGIEAFQKDFKRIEKVGKRKRWVGGRDGAGYKVEVRPQTGNHKA
ncbi:Ppx-GppA-domain-containing protein [Polychaeton citri CBS 116435]|uniref:Ppx-GppA-domain-containing protein n=1 Tax=Polychaeton citri CBS 116435 TaxID=1314669 RepID=A0A9P4QES7_9PEZI|nr:Ppx-GppA-domain-containing protein [Polychaeton citri CBS 116435]